MAALGRRWLGSFSLSFFSFLFFFCFQTVFLHSFVWRVRAAVCFDPPLTQCQRNPVDIFRDDMTRAAKQGLFCVDVDLAPHHGSTGFFRSPDVQNYLGETLAEEGIKVCIVLCFVSACVSHDVQISFGEPVLVNGYPSCRLSWYSTRRVVKWSRVVREEVSAKYYKEHGVPETAPGVVTGGQKPLAAGSENDSMTNFADVKVPRYSDDVRKGGVNYNTSGAVVSAIRGRREEQAAE